jgi:hypothetical protein
MCVEDRQSTHLALEPRTNLFKVRFANTESQRSSASYLIQRRYAWRGYAVGEHKDNAPSRITVAAHADNGTVGTLTIGFDLADGLFVEALYREEVAALRRTECRLAEFTRLAIDGDVRSKPLLAALFHVAFVYARRIHRCTDLLIEVNPRHVSFYRRMLGFDFLGPLRVDPRIGASAVLLRVSLEYVQGEIERWGGKAQVEPRTSSLYPYFFSAYDEMMIERRVRSLG